MRWRYIITTHDALTKRRYSIDFIFELAGSFESSSWHQKLSVEINQVEASLKSRESLNSEATRTNEDKFSFYVGNQF